VFPGGVEGLRLFLEERNGIHFRVESPFEPVLLFTAGPRGLRITESDHPEEALGFDPREDLIEDGGWDQDGWADLDERMAATVTVKFRDWGTAEDFAEALDATDFPYYMDEDEPLVTVEYSGERERESIERMAADFRAPVLVEIWNPDTGEEESPIATRLNRLSKRPPCDLRISPRCSGRAWWKLHDGGFACSSCLTALERERGLTETSAGTVQGRVPCGAPEAFMTDLRSWVNEYGLKGALIQGEPLPCGATSVIIPVHIPAQEKLRAIGDRHGVQVEIGTYDQNTGVKWRPMAESADARWWEVWDPQHSDMGALVFEFKDKWGADKFERYMRVEGQAGGERHMERRGNTVSVPQPYYRREKEEYLSRAKAYGGIVIRDDVLSRDLAEAVPDTGATGKQYEAKFKRACDLLGMKYEESGKTGVAGAVWDIRPATDGTPWYPLLRGEDVNLKVVTARFLISSREIYLAFHNLARKVKAGEITKAEADKRAERAVRSFFKKAGVPTTLFMKPKSKDIQNSIIKAVNAGDVEALEKLMVADSFSTKMLGEPYNVAIHVKWDAPDMQTGRGKRAPWQKGQLLHVEGLRGKKLRMGGEYKFSGGVPIVQFRTSPAPKAPFHRAKEPALVERAKRRIIDNPPEAGKGPTRAHGSYRFEIGKKKRRKPRRDVAMSLQNQRNAKRGQASRIAKAREWHRSAEGKRMHRDLGRFNRGPMVEAFDPYASGMGTAHGAPGALGRTPLDFRMKLDKLLARKKPAARIAGLAVAEALASGGDRLDVDTPSRAEEQAAYDVERLFRSMGVGPLTESADIQTMDDAFDDILRKLITIDSVDILQDVEFTDEGAIYLFFDPSLKKPEIDEILAAVTQANASAQLVASPMEPSSDWWVIFAPYSEGDGGALVPDSEVWSVTPEPIPGAMAPQTIVKPAITSVDKLAVGVDVDKLVKAVGESADPIMMLWSSPEDRTPRLKGTTSGAGAGLLEGLKAAAGRDEGALFLVRAPNVEEARRKIEVGRVEESSRGVYVVGS